MIPNARATGGEAYGVQHQIRQRRKTPSETPLLLIIKSKH